jgi:hypothetical protein
MGTLRRVSSERHEPFLLRATETIRPDALARSAQAHGHTIRTLMNWR